MIYLILLGVTLTAASLEAVSYLGFIAKHTGISAYLLYLGTTIGMFFVQLPSIRYGKLLQIMAIGASLVLLVLSFLEVAHYQNYVYTATHINLVSFQFLVTLLWLHTTILTERVSMPLERLAKGLLIGILVCLGGDGLGRTTSFVLNSTKIIVADPLASYESKMIKTYPGLYPALKQVVALTPENATILIPPQGNPWEYEGNGALVTYFLYPRRAVNLSEDGSVPEQSGPTYILIAKGSWPNRTGKLDYGWPKVRVNATRIWKFHTSERTVEEFVRDYHPSTDQFDWGLIEVAP